MRTAQALRATDAGGGAQPNAATRPAGTNGQPQAGYPRPQAQAGYPRPQGQPSAARPQAPNAQQQAKAQPKPQPKPAKNDKHDPEGGKGGNR